MVSIQIAFACAVLGVLNLSTSSLRAQSAEADIIARLKDKPLYLRGFWAADKLSFNSDGKLISKSDVGSFAVSGFDLQSAHLKEGKLILEGKRVGTEFLPSFAPKRVYLKGKIKLEVAPPANSDFGPALDAILIDGITALLPSMPQYWQAFARCHLNSPEIKPDCSLYPDKHPKSQAEPVSTRSNGKVTAPRVTKMGQVQANDYARQVNYSGITLVGFMCGADGVPSDVTILQPTGVGLDEQAVATVAQYRFVPAMQDGKPIAVQMAIKVAMPVL